MIINNLFPTPVAKFELGREFTSEETLFAVNQSVHKNVGNVTSNNHYVLKNDTLSNIAVFVQQCVDQYFQEIYAPNEDVKLQITQSWLNYSKPGEWHHKHAHANSFISGVLYIKAAKNRDRIYFWNESYKQIYIQSKNFNLYNSMSWWLPAETGNLLLFPSNFVHSVKTVEKEERISLSFNTFPVGLIGEENQLTALRI